jgi:hypothetical protein
VLHGPIFERSANDVRQYGDRPRAIASGASESRVESVIEAAAPVLDSIEFRAP